MSDELRLLPITETVEGLSEYLAQEPATAVVEAMRDLYQREGFLPPWIGYIAAVRDQAVGSCAFKSPPRGDRVEIAYFTFPGFEGMGIATAMTRELLRIARNAAPAVVVAAQTLPEFGASTSILKKLGFECRGAIVHPEDGIVWDWELPPIQLSGPNGC